MKTYAFKERPPVLQRRLLMLSCAMGVGFLLECIILTVSKTIWTNRRIST